MKPTPIIVDFEATCCDENEFPREEMEIIEIGAVAVNAETGQVDSEFSSFVRPVRNPILTEFCKSLTSISQDEVDKALGFPRVIETFRAWIQSHQNPLFCSWGRYDRNQLLRDCDYHSVPFPFSGDHRNLKEEFSQIIGSGKRFGVGEALRHLGLTFQGVQHRGIDDARNIARIYQKLFVHTR